MNKKLRIVFMGTPEFAVGVLSTLVDAGINIVGVITAPDRKAGRGRKLTPSAVKQYAVSKNIPVLQPLNLKSEEFLQQLQQLEANLQIVVAFRMLPKVVWQMPEYGTFNLHASLLPQYRGAAPINWAIINQEKVTGVTTFFIDDKIDTGEIILSNTVAIQENETVGTLHDTLMELGSALVLQTVQLIAQSNVTTKPQPLGEAYIKDGYKEAPKLDSENTYIDWTKSYPAINAHIRGLNPYPAAWTFLQNGDETLKVKIFDVDTVSAEDKATIEQWSLSENKTPVNTGNIIILNKNMYVKIENEFIKIVALQLPGKRKMLTKDLLNGFEFKEHVKMIVKPHSY